MNTFLFSKYSSLPVFGSSLTGPCTLPEHSHMLSHLWAVLTFHLPGMFFLSSLFSFCLLFDYFFKDPFSYFHKNLTWPSQPGAIFPFSEVLRQSGPMKFIVHPITKASIQEWVSTKSLKSELLDLNPDYTTMTLEKFLKPSKSQCLHFYQPHRIMNSRDASHNSELA